MNLLAGLELLHQRIASASDSVVLEFSTLEARLLENLDQERRYGVTEISRAERIRVIDSLNSFALGQLRTTFNQLCAAATQEILDAGSVSGHVLCFASFPSQGYDAIFQALRRVLEVRPYYWELLRASDRYFGQTVGGSITQHIKRAHCYIVDVTDGDFDVGIELGMMRMYPDRPILLIQRENASRRLVGIAGNLVLNYPAPKPGGIYQDQLVAGFQQGFEKREDFSGLASGAHYLSYQLLQQPWISDDLAVRLSKEFRTIEALLNTNPELVKHRLGLQQSGIIRDIQSYLSSLITQC